MVDEIVTRQELIDAKRDIEDIGKAVNEVKIVSPRYGEDFKSLPMIADEAQTTIGEWQDAINTIVINDGVPALAVSDSSGKTQQEINDYFKKTSSTVTSISRLRLKGNVSKGDRVYVESYYEPNTVLARPYFGGGYFIATQKAGLSDNGGTIIASTSAGIYWVRVGYDDVTPEFWGAYGDDVTDDTEKCQSAIDFSPTGVKFSFKYKISDTLLISGKPQYSLYGLGRSSWIRNVGVGKSAIKFVNSEGCSLSNMGIVGDGLGIYAPTAQTSHGVEFQGSSLANLTNVAIRSHGGHGIYIHKGGWCFYITNCKISFNKLDGINALSEPNGQGTHYQNGNNLSVVNTEFNANGGNAVHWKALALNINGCVIERSGKSGVFIDNSAWPLSTWSVNIAGNYFEAHKDHCIRVLTATNAILDGLNIEGNFFAGGNPFPNNGTYIKFEGLYTGVKNSSIRANGMIQYGSTTFIDGGGTLDGSVRIETSHPTQNTLFAKIEKGSKKRVINGALATKSISWSSMVGDSDNFHSPSAQTIIYFDLPVDSESSIRSIDFNVKTDSSAGYSVKSSLISVNPTTGQETPMSESIKTSTGGDLAFNHLIHRDGVAYPMYLKVAVPALPDASIAKISNLILTYN